MPNHRFSTVVVRGAGLIGFAAATAWLSWSLAGPVLGPAIDTLDRGEPTAWAGMAFPDAFEVAAALTALGCAAWLLSASAVVAVEAVTDTALRHDRPRSRSWLRPETLRRLVLAGGSAALGTWLATAPAAAEPVDAAPASVAGGSAAAVSTPLVGLPVPDRTSGSLTADLPAPTVTVRRGDSLWEIAARALPRNSSVADISAASRVLHRTNRPRVGPDPDVIFPGTTLDLSALLRSPGKDRP